MIPFAASVSPLAPLAPMAAFRRIHLYLATYAHHLLNFITVTTGGRGRFCPIAWKISIFCYFFFLTVASRRFFFFQFFYRARFRTDRCPRCRTRKKMVHASCGAGDQSDHCFRRLGKRLVVVFYFSSNSRYNGERSRRPPPKQVASHRNSPGIPGTA